MQQYLQLAGYNVSVAASPDEAIERADCVPPDVLVCDWQLDGDGGAPGVNNGRSPADGVETALHLQRRHRMAVIFVTGQRLGGLKAKAEATDLEVAFYRRKPLSLAAIALDIAVLAERP